MRAPRRRVFVPPNRPEWEQERRDRLAAGIGRASTLDPSVTCPSCHGPYMRGHPDSIIMFDHSGDCEARAHMDGQAVADMQAVDPRYGKYARPVTETELELLAAVGIVAGPSSIAHLVERHSYRYEIERD